MPAVAVTPHDRLTIVKLLAAGRSAQFVADAMTMTRDAVVDVASHHGYPDTAKLATAASILQANIDKAAAPPAQGMRVVPRPGPAPRPTAPVVPSSRQPAQSRPLTEEAQELSDLLHDGLSALNPATRKLAQQVKVQLDKLKAALAADVAALEAERQSAEERKRLLAEQEQLQERLKAIQAKLGRPAKSGRGGGSGQPDARRLTSEHTRQVLTRLGATRAELVEWALANGHKAGGPVIARKVVDAFEASRA